MPNEILQDSNSSFNFVTTVSNTFLTKVQALTADDWDEELFRPKADNEVLEKYHVSMTINPPTYQMDNVAPLSINTKQIMVHTGWSAKKDANGAPYFQLFDSPETRAEVLKLNDERQRTALVNRLIATGQVTKKYYNLPIKYNYFKEDLDNLVTELTANHKFSLQGRIRYASLVKTKETDYYLSPLEGLSRDPKSLDQASEVLLEERKILNPALNKAGLRKPIRRLILPLVVPDNVIFKLDEEEIILKPNELWAIRPSFQLHIHNPDGAEVIFMRLIWQTSDHLMNIDF